MARSVEEIFNQMVSEKQSLSALDPYLPEYNLPTDNPYQLLLNELSSWSKVSIWRLWIFMVALAHHQFEVLMDYFKAEQDQVAAQSIAGNLPWYRDQALKFQSGHSLTFNPNTYRYSYLIDDPGSRIIAKCAVVEENNLNVNGIVIKVAKLSSGNLVPLSAPEKIEFNTYINRIKFAGVQSVVISEQPDQIRLELDVFYDGTLDLTEFKTRFEASISDYLNNGIDFDGNFIKNKLIDKFQSVDGFIDCDLNLVEAKADYLPSFTTVDRIYSPYSGYFTLIGIGSGPSDTQINYIAQ